MANTTAIAITDAILGAVRGVVPAEQGSVMLHEPEFRGREWEYVRDCLDTGWVSSVGSYVDRFERLLAEVTGAAHVVVTVNGTAALHISLLLAGVLPNDEVLVPAFTFIATANAVSYCGAIPHFVDSEARTLGMDPSALERYLHQTTVRRGDVLINRATGRIVRAVVPMHTFGHPVDLDGLLEVCCSYGLTMVEDAAESLGSTYNGIHTGRFGKLAALSFNGNKIITTGAGGAILTNDAELGRHAKHLTTTARVQHRWEVSHDEIGFNYRMPNLNAALGCAQLENLSSFVERKRRLATHYALAFDKIEGITFMQEPTKAHSNYWLNAILLHAEMAHSRDDILQCLNDAGIMVRPAWNLIHRLPMYQDCPRAPLPVAENIERRLINLPSSARLSP